MPDYYFVNRENGKRIKVVPKKKPSIKIRKTPKTTYKKVVAQGMKSYLKRLTS